MFVTLSITVPLVIPMLPFDSCNIDIDKNDEATKRFKYITKILKTSLFLIFCILTVPGLLHMRNIPPTGAWDRRCVTIELVTPLAGSLADVL